MGTRTLARTCTLLIYSSISGTDSVAQLGKQLQ